MSCFQRVIVIFVTRDSRLKLDLLTLRFPFAVWRLVCTLQRWAYAADALEELCPGAASATSTADLSRHWRPSPPPPPDASAGLAGVNGGSGDKQRPTEHDPPTAVVASAASAAAAGDVKGVRVNAERGPMAVSAGQQHQTAPSNDGDEAHRGGMGATTVNTLGEPSGSEPAAVQAALGLPQPRPVFDTTSSNAALTAAAFPAAGGSAEYKDGGGLRVSLNAPSASPQPTEEAVPVAEAIAFPSAALAGPRAPQQRQPRPQQHGEEVLSLPAAACNEETLVAVARELHEYAEAIARARSSREATGGGKGGGGGRDVAGGALGAGALGAVSPSLYLQEPPPEGLFDALLDEVLQALGDA